jgi:hypothetical protein
MPRYSARTMACASATCALTSATTAFFSVRFRLKVCTPSVKISALLLKQNPFLMSDSTLKTFYGDHLAGNYSCLGMRHLRRVLSICRRGRSQIPFFTHHQQTYIKSKGHLRSLITSLLSAVMLKIKSPKAFASRARERDSSFFFMQPSWLDQHERLHPWC